MGKKTRVVGGADSTCAVALMEGLKAGRKLLRERSDSQCPTPEDYDKAIWAGVVTHMDAEFDLSARGPKGQLEKMRRRYEAQPSLLSLETDDQLDQVIDEAKADEANFVIEPSPLRELGEQLVEEYARKGRPTPSKLGGKFFMRKVEKDGDFYLAVGCSSGMYGGVRCFANAGIGNTVCNDLPKDKIVYEGAGPYKAMKIDEGRTFEMFFLHYKPGQKFRIWWNLADISGTKKDAMRFWLVMSNNNDGFAQDPTRKKQGVQDGFEKMGNGLVLPRAS